VRITSNAGVTSFCMDTASGWLTGFGGLRNQMKHIVELHPSAHPGFEHNNTSMAVFQAFGLDRTSWADGVRFLEFSQQIIRRDLGAGADVECKVDDEGFWISYKSSGANQTGGNGIWK